MKALITEEMPYFGEEGLSCSESTLRLLIERGVVNLPLSTVRLMTGLHGNMKRDANCGAINGGVAAIGAELGRLEPGEDMSLFYETVEKFISEFEARFGSVKCEGLLAGRPQETVEEQNRCAVYVLAAADIVERLLKEAKAKQAK
ncbi:MAG: C-GCAxxG-C-C family (seleno)protein [Oscillospiraceae bacterium]